MLTYLTELIFKKESKYNVIIIESYKCKVIISFRPKLNRIKHHIITICYNILLAIQLYILIIYSQSLRKF